MKNQTVSAITIPLVRSASPWALRQFGLLAVVILLACGRQAPGVAQQNESRTPPFQPPTELGTVSHPNLAGLEPKAREAVEAQKNELEEILVNASGDKARLNEAYGRMGMFYFSFRFKKAAETCLLNAYLLDAGKLRWAYFLGQLYRESGAPQKALFFLEKAHALKQDEPAINVSLAEVLRERDEPARAKRLFEQVLVKDPQNPPALMGLGLLAAVDEEHAKAIEYFERVLKIQPRASAALYPLALSYQATGNQEMAERAMAARGEVKPRMDDPLMKMIDLPRALAHYRMAETLRLTGKPGESLPHYDLVVDLFPENPGVRLGRELASIELARYLAAVIALHEDVGDFPKLAVFQHMLARLFASSPDERARDGANAIVILRELTRGAATPELAESLAMAFAEVGRFPDAIKAQEKAIDMAGKAGDTNLVERMKPNLEAYRNGHPCRLPWRGDDPIFKMVTYGKYQQALAREEP